MTRKLTIDKTLHSRDVKDVLYEYRKGGRGHARIVPCADASTRQLEAYLQKKE